MKLAELLNQIDRLDDSESKGPWWEMRVAALAKTALPQLAEAVRGVLDVLDDYTMPGKLHDPTGIAGAELESLEGYIREAIHEALGEA